jgi:regulatory protein
MDDESPRPRRASRRAPGEPRAKKVPGPLTEGSLRYAALHYVERYPSTVVGLIRVLKRKVQTWARKTELPPPEEVGEWIARIVSDIVDRGFVDDRRLAAAKTASLQRKGKSKRAVEATLRAKGVQSVVIDEVLAASTGSDEDAAWVLARKKKLGPYRDPALRREHRQKDMAVLGRAGFSFLLARTIVESDEPR